jgi:hypothetical protein
MPPERKTTIQYLFSNSGQSPADLRGIKRFYREVGASGELLFKCEGFTAFALLLYYFAYHTPQAKNQAA